MTVPLRKRFLSHNIFFGMGRKFIFYFIFFSIVPILCISVLGFKLSEQIVINQNLKYLNLRNEIFSHHLNELLEQVSTDLNAEMQENPSVWRNHFLSRGTVVPPSQKSGRASQTPVRQNRTIPSFKTFAVFDGTGRAIFDPNSIISPELEAELLPAPRGNQQIHVIHLKDEQPVLVLVKNVAQPPPGQKDFVVVAEVNQEIILEKDQSFSNSGEKIETFLFDKSTGETFSLAATLNRTEASFSNIFSKKNRFFKRWDGKNVIRRFLPFQDENLFIVSDISYPQAMQEIITFRRKAILGIGSLLILFIGLAFYFSQRITIPIRQLVYSAQDIGEGMLETPIRIDTKDEVALLANELDQMRKNLLDSYENLENKVQERTRELKKAQFQIMHQEKMASIGLLAAGIAHEIGNPLTSISSLTQLLKRRLKDEKNSAYLATIMKNIDRISKIVRELVDFSRPSKYEEKFTDVNEVARAAVGIVKYDSRSKNIHIEMDLQPNLPKLILVADQLLQVFINILFNAVDAMEEYGDNLKFITKSVTDSILIRIEDSGCGIPPEEINKIFEPFYTTKEVGKGTGLGLSVSYGIIKNFGGKLEVKSVVGKGSAFSIMLPIKKSGRENKDEE